MALQVGSYCYATPADAGAAACAAMVPSSTVSGSSVVTLSCVGSDEAGALHVRSAVAPADGSASGVVSTVVQPVAFQPCQQGDYVTAAQGIGVSVLMIWMLIYSYRKIIETLNWGRGESV